MSEDKWKVAERMIATKLQAAAGVVKELPMANLVTSTGRIGHLTELGADLAVGNKSDQTDMIGEVKRRKLPKWFTDALVQIVQRGFEYGRTPFMGFQLADDVPAFLTTKQGARKRMIRTWAMVPLPYFTELLEDRRTLQRLLDEGVVKDTDVEQAREMCGYGTD